MTDEQPQRRQDGSDRVRDFVWHMRTRIERSQLHMDEVKGFLDGLAERRRVLREQLPERGSDGPRDGDASGEGPALEQALAELDGTQEEIRVVGEEMERRGAQLVAWEAEAAAKLRFHRRLMERAPLSFFLTDENGMIADANEEAARMLHVTPAYLRSKPIVNFVSRRDVSNARGFIRAVARSEQVLENVLVFRPRRGGATCRTEVRACALSRNDEHALGWLVREVPAAKSEPGESGDEAATAEPPSSLPPSSDLPSLEILAAVSHELRSPIETIQSAAYLLRRALPADDGMSRAHEHCDSIVRASQVLARVTTVLLDAASVEAGRFTIERVTCDLRRLVEQLLTAHEPRARRRGLELVGVLPQEAALVDGDVVRLTQVLATLLDNALELTAAHEGKRVTVELTVQPEHARLEVIDEGCGIRPEHLPHVFERHWRAPGTTGAGRGGLGLWLARAIALVHGGVLTAASASGEGARFRLELPRSRGHAHGGAHGPET